MADDKGFDLSVAEPVAQREDEGQVVHLHDATGEALYHAGGKPVTATVVGSYSQTYQRAFRELKRKWRKRSTRALRNDDNEQDQLDLAAACVTAWDGFYNKGEKLECTKANVLKVFQAAPWIREQVEAAIEDHAGFFPNA